MNVQLILFGLALLLRVASGLWGDRGWLTRPLTHLFAKTAVWLTLVGIGAWAPAWPIPLFALVGLGASLRWSEEGGVRMVTGTSASDLGRRSVQAVTDALLVLIAARFSLPALSWGFTVVALILLPLIGWLIDSFVEQLQKWVAWWLLGGVALLGMVIILLIPTSNRLLSSRFVYLLPESSETESMLTATQTPDGNQILVAEETAVSPQTPTPIIIEAEETSVLDASGRQWSPYLEWRLPNATYEGNPFDLVATATFVHAESGETHTTGLFYAGEDEWWFRFTATQSGEWQFSTESEDGELNGRFGTIHITPNPDVAGFVTHYGNKWGRSGIDRAFVPQYVMIGGPQTYVNNPAEIEANIQTFFVEHGFNGVHTPVFCRWFDIEQQQCSRINVADPNPDYRTFEALEMLIREVHAAGGVVHIWMWGDDSRSENPKRWGINGTADVRLQRYIAARLGPLPGWTMGYGYDLFEWVDEDELTQWHEMMQTHLGWTHYLGARSAKNQLSQLSETMDYASFEQHRPGYGLYVRTIEQYADKPAFSEDRFRIRNEGRAKDYTMEATRRGLWHSTMAGGVANIWGNLVGAAGANTSATTSSPYPNPEQIKTYALFFEERFWADMVVCETETAHSFEGVGAVICLMRPTQAHYLLYAEDVTTIQLDLRGMNGMETAVAIDTRLPYAEINLGEFGSDVYSWTAPYESDWAIAVGQFSE